MITENSNGSSTNVNVYVTDTIIAKLYHFWAYILAMYIGT